MHSALKGQAITQQRKNVCYLKKKSNEKKEGMDGSRKKYWLYSKWSFGEEK